MPANKELTFYKNCDLWAKTDPKQAVLLPFHPPHTVYFHQEPEEALNLINKKATPYFYHAKHPLDEAEEWFKTLTLSSSPVLCVFGIGLGYYYSVMRAWLEGDKKRRLLFLEDDLEVIYRFLETEEATHLLHNSQVQLLYFKDIEKDELFFEKLYWDYARLTMPITALNAYQIERKKIFEQLQRKITYDFAIKNALLDEYLRYGGAFFVNFYRNLMSLPHSYLGNKTFGSFRKIPAIICGAGPSLTKDLELLAQLDQKALIFAGGSAMNALNAVGIQPHLGAGIDPNPAQFDRLNANHAFETPFYYRNRLHHDAFKLIHGPRLYITGCGGYDIADYFEEKLAIAHQDFLDEGHNVINFCLQIAKQLGCDPIILIGLDLAFTGMQSYAPGIEKNTLFDPQQFEHVEEFDEKPLLLKDIEGQPLYTLWKWIAESEWIGDFAKENPEVTIINATQGGLGCPGIANESLGSLIEQYLTRAYPIRERLHTEIQNSTMAHVTPLAVRTSLEELQLSLQRVLEHLAVLIQEAEQVAITHRDQQSGAAALCEIELAEEPAYQYILDIFNLVQIRLYYKELHDLKQLSFPDSLIAKSHLNGQRLKFLKEVTQINLLLIDQALKLPQPKENEQRAPNSLSHPFMTSPMPFLGSSTLLIPADPFEGQAVEDHIVMLLRQYNQPPEEARLEKRGVINGQCLLYYPNQTLKAELFYKQDALHGPIKFYSPEGQLLAHSFFEEGKQEKEAYWYYSTGELYAIQRYALGQWHGLQEYFYPSGTLKTSLVYQHGKLEKASTFSMNGEVKKELNLTN